MRNTTLSLALLLTCGVAAHARQAPPISVPIDVSVRHAPVPFNANGNTHLVYELTMSNLAATDSVLERVAIHAADASGGLGAELGAYAGRKAAAGRRGRRCRRRRSARWKCRCRTRSCGSEEGYNRWCV